MGEEFILQFFVSLVPPLLPDFVPLPNVAKREEDNLDVTEKISECQQRLAKQSAYPQQPAQHTARR